MRRMFWKVFRRIVFITELPERESPLRCDSTPFRGGMKVRLDTECDKPVGFVTL
jgi:hypothetical protein